MTGSEAWSLVAPIITPLLAVENVDTEMVCEMYVIVHIALKEYDERRMGEEHDSQMSSNTARQDGLPKPAVLPRKAE